MYKLGILGTCNTHAEIFSGLFNRYRDNLENCGKQDKHDNLENCSKQDKHDNPENHGKQDKLYNPDKYDSFDFYGFGKTKVEYIFGFDIEKTKQIASATTISRQQFYYTQAFDFAIPLQTSF